MRESMASKVVGTEAQSPAPLQKVLRPFVRCLATSLFGNSLYNAPLWVEGGWNWTVCFVACLQLSRWIPSRKFFE